MNEYDIFMENTVVGTVVVQQCGLFTHFKCVCRPKEKTLCRVIAVYEDKSVDLGICVIDGEAFVTQAKIPTKHLGKGLPKFYINSKKSNINNYVPLLREEKFLYLSKINTAYFESRDGIAGLVFNYPDLEVTHQNK